MKVDLQVIRLGRISYTNAISLQTKCREKLLSDGKKRGRNTIFLLEHNPVYTVGLRSREYTTDIESRLRQLGAEFYQTDRGGLITFHGPGQLVAYPVINLKHFGLGMKAYVCQLQHSIIGTCEKFGIKAETTEHTGVWVNDRKIAAIGVHGTRFVTTHGLALNCNTDLRWFNHIIPCGIEGKGVTSLSVELDRVISISEASKHFLASFSECFHCALFEDSEYSEHFCQSSVE